MSNYTPKKLGTLERMDKFLETCKLPRLNHEETENLNRLLLRRFNQSSETCRQKPSTDGFKGEFYQTFKELILIHLKLFPKIAKEGKLVKSFYKASIILMPNPKITKKRKLQANITDEHRCKNP